jgi:chromate reductase, NAD(P)H dehydrogenase (quinone)
MGDPNTVAVIVGSLRQDSLTRRVAETLIRLSPPSLTFLSIEIGNLPLYNEDLEGGGMTPEPWKRLREEIVAADAVLFATPEYNRSAPAALKNALDVGSRPYGQSVWDGKPAAVVSVSPGAMGAFGANHHLRQSLVFLNMPTMQQPEAYIGHADSLFQPDGGIGSDGTAVFLTGLMSKFATWVDTVAVRQNLIEL